MVPRSVGPLARRGEEIFEQYNCYPGEGQRNHCLRLFQFARLHLATASQDDEDDFLYLAALLHDLGLMVPIRPGTNYLTRTVELARQELDQDNLNAEAWRQLEECLLFNHALRPPFALTPVAEAFRRAVFTEHSRGLQRFGLPRQRVKKVFRDIRYENFGFVLADFIWKTMVFEPKTLRDVLLPR
jgi:hypothetical protein